MIKDPKYLIIKNGLLCLFVVCFSCTTPKELISLDGLPKLKNKINNIIDHSDININMSIKFVTLNDFKTLYSYNSKKLLIPASNNKLYTLAAALYYLGSDYSFSTTVLKNKNNLILRGGGDPDLSIEQLDSLAKIVSKILNKVDTLYLDDNLLDSLHYGPGWMWDEGSSWWVAPIGVLSLNDNSIDFHIKPGDVNKPAIINHIPATQYIKVNNKSKTVNDTLNYKKLNIERNWISQNNHFLVTGEVLDTASIDTIYRNINNPTLFTGTIFKELLEKHGVLVKYLSKNIPPENYEIIAVHNSNMLIESAKDLMFESKNLTAELFVKTIGTLDTIPGTWKVGIDSIKSFLTREVKLDTSNLRIADGSGISRYSLTNSNQIVSLLQWVYKSKYKNTFLNTLPTGGNILKKGLKDRFIKEGEIVKAKTGHLSGVSNLSGYIFSPKYGPIAFSILMNGYKGSHKKYRNIQDQIVKTIIYD
tara:strand:+ start:49 stop:1473 length:1425 start_codon:yes stop_codon:yes gene_type:complete